MRSPGRQRGYIEGHAKSRPRETELPRALDPEAASHPERDGTECNGDPIGRLMIAEVERRTKRISWHTRPGPFCVDPVKIVQ